MALGKERLKELVVAKGLAPSGMNKNVEVLLQHEAKCAEELREYKAKVMEQLSAKKEALEAKTGQQLQELCTSKGLSVGTSKEDRVQRLLRDANENGEVDQAIRLAKRAARRRDLEAMDKAALRQVSTELEVDPHVKSVIVERLMHHEAEEPVDLKQRASRSNEFGIRQSRSRSGARNITTFVSLRATRLLECSRGSVHLHSLCKAWASGALACPLQRDLKHFLAGCLYALPWSVVSSGDPSLSAPLAGATTVGMSHLGSGWCTPAPAAVAQSG